MNTSLRSNNQMNSPDLRDTSFSVFQQNKEQRRTEKEAVIPNASYNSVSNDENPQFTYCMICVIVLIKVLCLIIIFNSETFSARWNSSVVLFFTFVLICVNTYTSVFKNIWAFVALLIRKFAEASKRKLLSKRDEVKEKYNNKKVSELIQKSFEKSGLKQQKFDNSFLAATNDSKAFNLDHIFKSDNSFRLIKEDKTNLVSQNKNKIADTINKLISNQLLRNKLLPINECYEFNEELYHNQLEKLGLDHIRLKLFARKLKDSFLIKSITKLIDYNNVNLLTINRLFKPYKINLSTEIDKSNFTDEAIQEIHKRITKFNPSVSNSVQINDEINIFFAHTSLISYLIDIIDAKIHNINKVIKFDPNSSKFNQQAKGKFNLLFYSDLSSVLYRNREVEDSMSKLKFELETRLELNNFIYPENVKNVSNEYEYFLMLDYIMKRLEALGKNNLDNYQFANGGSYLKDSWKSFFPTDSELLIELLVKSLHNAMVDNNNIIKCILLSYPYKPIENSGYDSTLIIYKSSPSNYETNFDIFYKKEYIRLPFVSIFYFNVFNIKYNRERIICF